MPNKASWMLWLEKGRANLCRARSGATHRPFPGSEKRNVEQWKTLVFKKRNNRIEKKGDILSKEGPFWGPLQAPDWLEDPRCSPEPFIDLENPSTWCGAMGPRKRWAGEGATLWGKQGVYLRRNGPGREEKGTMLECPRPVNRSQDTWTFPSMCLWMRTGQPRQRLHNLSFPAN